MLGLNFVFRIAISIPFLTFFVYFNEIYPAQVRALVGHFVSSIGGVLLIFMPMLIDFCLIWKVPIMLVLTLLGLLATVLVYQLPETFQVPPKEVVQELEDAK